MKTLRILVAIIAMAFFMWAVTDGEVITHDNDVDKTEYCRGWEDGYCEGWKDVKGQFSVCPITPVCPVSKIQCSEGYKCGYNRGFKAGRKKANKK